MNKIRVIKNNEDYKEALEYIEELIDLDPNPNSIEGEQLSLLSDLIESYEKSAFPQELPDPIEAIKFRMEQADLEAADLIPYFGSRSRVSEVFSGKRNLTIEMMRVLERGLGIPAKVLIQEPKKNEDSIFSTWSKSLLQEMARHGYFEKTKIDLANTKALLKDFFSPIGSPLQLQGLLREANYRSAPTSDKYALAAWSARVLKKSKEVKLERYKPGTVNLNFMQNLAKLSIEKASPLLAQEYLRKNGIILIIEPHLTKTRLDGIALLANKENPVIGLTLRLNRLDNFWFTLMHELAHIALHFNDEINLFYDELDEIKGLDIGQKEREADAMASKALVPNEKWEISPARLIPTTMAAKSLANELNLHIAIIAGKIRYETGNFHYLNDIVSQEKVQVYFPNNNWSKK